MIRLIIFDLDGTLADTSLGIVNSHRYAHRMMGREEPSSDELRAVIGGPLLSTYRDRFGFSDEEARRALAYYRSWYAEKGIHEAIPYPGVKDLLESLKRKGFLLSVATLKSERLAKALLHNMELLSYFDAVHGMDESDSRTKASLIQMCMNDMQVGRHETVLVGDSVHDLEGAKDVGIAFVGVSYGFGFKNSIQPEGVNICDDPYMVQAMIGLAV